MAPTRSYATLCSAGSWECRGLWDFYLRNLGDWASSTGAELPYVPAHCDQPYHMFYLLLPSLEERQDLIRSLKAKGISAVFHYVSLHLSPMGRQFGGKEGDCPVTERVSDRLLRLPFYNDLSEAEQSRVVEAMYAWSKSRLPDSGRLRKASDV